MALPTKQLSALAPFLNFTHLEALTADDLDRHAHRAEDCMNGALEQRRWSLASCYRDIVLATRRELDRRDSARGEGRDQSRKAR
jgi:hypothetical protein